MRAARSDNNAKSISKFRNNIKEMIEAKKAWHAVSHIDLGPCSSLPSTADFSTRYNSHRSENQSIISSYLSVPRRDEIIAMHENNANASTLELDDEYGATCKPPDVNRRFKSIFQDSQASNLENTYNSRKQPLRHRKRRKKSRKIVVDESENFDQFTSQSAALRNLVNRNSRSQKTLFPSVYANKDQYHQTVRQPVLDSILSKHD